MLPLPREILDKLGKIKALNAQAKRVYSRLVTELTQLNSVPFAVESDVSFLH